MDGTQPAFERETRTKWFSPIQAVLEQNKILRVLDKDRLPFPVTLDVVAAMARARTLRILP